MTSDARSIRVAQAAHRLAACLNGTHHGIHRQGHRDFAPRAVAQAFSLLDLGTHGGEQATTLGGSAWEPANEAERRLRSTLAVCLAMDEIVELVFFGSIARGATTGFSDVDAILVIDDEAVMDASRLRLLRHRVFAAGRAVLAYQPMQHHGFLIATPRLLGYGTEPLRLPREAVAETVSLFGRTVEVKTGRGGTATQAFDALVESLGSVRSWPAHPWFLHRTIATFELAPTLYLQATGRACPKHLSFDLARADFQESWAPYDVLAEVRRRWPRKQMQGLRQLAWLLRNPWVACAVRRRLPAAVPSGIDDLLDETCLNDLRRLLALMADNVK